MIRAFSNVIGEMPEAGYTKDEIDLIKKDVAHFKNVREEIKLASGDYIDLKAYEPAMRQLIDTYISADESEKISTFDDMSLVELIVERGKDAIEAVYPPAGRVRIAAPLSVDDEAVRLFAISKLYWIRKQQKGFENQERQSPREYITGESHYFEGNRYLLNVVYGPGTSKVSIRNKTYIDLIVTRESDLEQRKRVMNAWYRGNLRERVIPLLRKWQDKIGVEISDWQIRQMKTKWGSCKVSTGRVWLNLELMKKPGHCLEYIIVHELLHFKVRNHNDQYVALMNKCLPQWRSSQEELNRFIVSYDEWRY